MKMKWLLLVLVLALFAFVIVVAAYEGHVIVQVLNGIDLAGGTCNTSCVSGG